jgi:hypothetical protein
MKIRELFNESEGDHYTFASPKAPQVIRTEGPPLTRANMQDPNYTPGKAALDRAYDKIEDFTHTEIPNKQKKLDDPRN